MRDESPDRATAGGIEPMPAIPVVHAVTDDLVVAAPAFLARACAVLEALGPLGALHLRAPSMAGRELHDLVVALLPLSRRGGARLVVNDRVDVAVASGAWGAQLTSRSLSVADARRVLPPGRTPLRLGASVHAPAEAALAATEGASWIVAGNVYVTPSHAGADGRGVDFVRAVVAAAGGAVPVIAIGGVRPEHVATLRGAGAHGVAVIRGIWGASDAGRAASDYLAAHESYERGGDDAGDDARRERHDGSTGGRRTR